MANEVTKFNIGGVDHAVMDEGARSLIATLQTALDALTSGDTTTAIETFKEVLDFLAGVTDDETLAGKLTSLNADISAKYTKPNDGIPASDLASAVQAILSSVSGKAEKSEMSVTDGTGANADKTTIQLKNGTTATVLKSHQSLSNYVQKDGDKVLSDNNYTDAEKTKLGTLPTNDDLQAALDAIVAGEQVPYEAGEIAIIDSASSANADTVLGAASARWVKEIDDNVKAILAALANIAFTSTKPTWQTVAKRTYTLSYGTLTGCTADVTAGSVDEGYLKIIFTPTQSSYAFTSITVNNESVTPTRTSESDGSVYIEIVVSENITVVATAISGYEVSLASGSNCSLSPASVTPNGTYSGTLSPNQHYSLPSSISATVGGNAITFDGTTNSYNSSTGAIIIANVTGAVVITASAVAMTPIVVTLNGTNVSFFNGSTELTGGTVSVYPDDYSAGNPYVIRMVADSGYSFTGAPTTTGANSVTADGDDYVLNVDANETANFAITATASMPTTLELNTKWFADPATTPTITAGQPFTLELTPLSNYVAAATQDAGTANEKAVRAAVQVTMNGNDISNDSGVVTFDTANNKVTIYIANPSGTVVINATARLKIRRNAIYMDTNGQLTTTSTATGYGAILGLVKFPDELLGSSGNIIKKLYIGIGGSGNYNAKTLFYSSNGTYVDRDGSNTKDKNYESFSYTTAVSCKMSVHLAEATGATVDGDYPFMKATTTSSNTWVNILTRDDFLNALYVDS